MPEIDAGLINARRFKGENKREAQRKAGQGHRNSFGDQIGNGDSAINCLSLRREGGDLPPLFYKYTTKNIKKYQKIVRKGD